MASVLSTSAALIFPLVTAKMAPAEVARLKSMFVRPGFVREIDSLEARTREFAARVSGKEAAAPSAAWKLLYSAEPNLVLSLLYSSKSGAVQTRLKTFLTDSPTARQRIPYTLMQEMRITADLPEYGELVNKLFFELMDGKLSTPEEMKAFLEPYSPPAPPPPVNLRRARAKKEARPSRAKSKKAVAADAVPLTVAAEEEATGVAEGIMEPGTLTGPDRGPEPTLNTPLVGKVAPEAAPPARPARKVAAGSEAPVIPAAPAKVIQAAAKAAPASNAPAASKSTPAKGVPAASNAAAKTPKAAPKGATKSAEASKKAAPAKKVAAPAKAVAVKSVPVKAPAKKAAPGKKAAPAKVAAKKASAAKKATPLKTTAKQALPAKKSAPAKKRMAAKKAPAKAAAKKSSAGRR